MKVFISYARKDEALAGKVAAALEEAGLDAWYDKREIVAGENWVDNIAEGLKESDAMVVLLTPNALKSNLVRLGLDYALTEKVYKNRLIPVLVGAPEDFSANQIPWILKQMNMIKLPKHGRNEKHLKQIAQALKEVA